jgi:hypothetical protein
VFARDGHLLAAPLVEREYAGVHEGYRSSVAS